MAFPQSCVNDGLMEVGWASNDLVLAMCDWELKETYDPYDD